MNAEIIAVGSELLLGQITNTNAKFLSTQLSQVGINVYYHTVVGDNSERLKKAIEIAESRANLLIFTGGLGPTKDDLTKETVASHLQTALVTDVKAMHAIEKYFEKVNRPMTENNRKQALVLENCTVLNNDNGMAPGMHYENETHTYVLLPGPPKELHPMVETKLMPILAQKLSKHEKITSHVLKFYGIGEAELETNLEDLLEKQLNPTIAPLASDGEVSIRITAKADNDEQANALIIEAKEAILNRVGQFVYGENEDTLQSRLVALLKEQNYTIAAAESLTAGLFTAEIANVAGAGAVLLGGVVTYAVSAKVEQLKIDQSLIDQYGVISSECAAAMAKHVKDKFKSDIGVGLTGVAGPYDEGDIPAGTVWLGFALPNGEVKTHKLQLSSDRNMNRLRAVKFAYNYLIRNLKK
jgi:nicotinamide-nucleotide amidase